MENRPLVSIAIPAYNPGFFEPALVSALRQTCSDVEILVCDDSCQERIQRIVETHGDTRIRYVRNEANLGFAGNFSQCLDLARGEYIKFLNDDDLLHPECVARMLAVFEEHGSTLTLVTSKRRLINASGQPMKDTWDTMPLTVVNARMKGLDLGDHVLRHSINFIGEPTTAMFRKRDLETGGDHIFRMGNNEYICLADLSLWLRLLSRGDAVYLADELSCFRVHQNQEQRKPDVALKCIVERYYLVDDGISLGFLRDRRLQEQALRSVLAIFGNVLSGGNLPEASRERLSGIRQSIVARLTTLGASPP